MILSTAGDHDLGGKNWDDRIATFLVERFSAETGFDPLDDPVEALNVKYFSAQRAGEILALSERSSTQGSRSSSPRSVTARSSSAAPNLEAMRFPHGRTALAG